MLAADISSQSVVVVMVDRSHLGSHRGRNATLAVGLAISPEIALHPKILRIGRSATPVGDRVIWPRIARRRKTSGIVIEADIMEDTEAATEGTRRAEESG